MTINNFNSKIRGTENTALMQAFRKLNRVENLAKLVSDENISLLAWANWGDTEVTQPVGV